MQVLAGQPDACFCSVLRSLYFARKLTSQALERPLGAAQELEILFLLAIGVCIEVRESQVNADGFAAGLDGDVTISIIHSELGVVAVGAAHQAHPFDRTQRVPEQITCALELERPRFHAIGQCEMPPHLIKRPPRRFVLNRPAVRLESWVPFFPWFLLATILVEACDGRTGTLRSSLSGHGVQLADELVLLGQDGTVLVQIIGRNAPCVLPVPHTLIADELCGTNGLVNRVELPGLAR